jgi:predicted flap endonuclease-1-like 5' DNA nuclease
MRSDYALYAVAIIFFIITVITAIAESTSQPLWVETTAILGVLFAGLGFTQRPKPKAKVTIQTPIITQATTPAPTEPIAVSPPPVIEPIAVSQPPVIEPIKEEKIDVTPPITPSITELTEVNGIGERRKAQLSGMGINNVEDLSKASPSDLAAKLKISPKITEKWVDSAKKLLEKT